MITDTDLLKTFVDETREHLDKLEADLLAMEHTRGDKEMLNRIFRAVHSIKGSAGFFKFKAISALSHVMEDLMAKVRDGLLSVHQDMVDALLAGKDKLRQMLDDLDRSETVDYSAEHAAIKALVESVVAAPGPGMPTAATPKPECPVSVEPPSAETTPAPDDLGGLTLDPAVVENALRHGGSIYRIRLSLRDDLESKGRTLSDCLATARSLGTILDSSAERESDRRHASCLPSDTPFTFTYATVLEPDLAALGLELPADRIRRLTPAEVKAATERNQGAVMSPVTRPENASLVRDSPPEAISRHPAQPPVQPPKADEPVRMPRLDGMRATAGETIRVPVSLLDDLMNLAGEMVLGRNQLLRMTDSMAKTAPGMPALLKNINLLTSDLQEKVMRTRLQPVGNVFAKFPRIIRDMSKRLGKEINFQMSGQEVELDKSLLELLSDPLTHLIRNCADHAIEAPDAREQAGKPRVGQVRLAAFHEGGQVHIEITDDGQGIDPRRIRRKAVEKGFLKPEEARQLADCETLALIFLPGLSTAEKVTDVSGRGVGMDVVKTNIEMLGGTVAVESNVGVGTRVSVRLPLNLSIIPALVVWSGGRRLAVPQASLEELARLDRAAPMERIGEVEVLRLRDTLLPLVDLPALWRPAKGARDPTAEDGKHRYVMVLKTGAHRFGLVVDALGDSEEIVVKPLSGYLKKCRLYSGATIMGDGKVAMILDAAGIADCAKLRFAEIEEAARKHQAEAAARDRVGESQLLVLFRNAERESFAVSLSLVSRLEKVKTAEIQRLGGREYIAYRETSLRLLRLHDFMPVSKPAREPETLYVIVPKFCKHPMGIVATKIDDVVDTTVAPDRDHVTGPGILGSFMLNGQLVVFLDLQALFETADPEVYVDTYATKLDKENAGACAYGRL